MKNMILTGLCALMMTSAAQAASSTWGGKGAELVIRGQSARLEFDCAVATFPRGFAFKSGEARAEGTFIGGAGVPLPPGRPGPKGVPVRVRAIIRDGLMRLTVATQAEPGDESSRWVRKNYVLKFGARGELYRCM